MVKRKMRPLIFGVSAVLSLGIFLGTSSFGDDLSRGMIVYQANCLQCHGERGNGNGPEAVQFNPKPTDFTASGMAALSESIIEKAIVEGVPDVPTHSWGGKLSKEDVEAVSKYIRSFQK